MNRFIYFLFVFISLVPAVRGQSVNEIGREVQQYLFQLDKWDTVRNVEGTYDSMSAVNHRLLMYMVRACTNNIPLLNADPDFKFSRYGIQVTTSDDRKFRIYDWMGEGAMGATQNSVLIQYKTKSGTAAKVVSDASQPDEFSTTTGYNCLAIHTIKTKNNGVVYLVVDGVKAAMGLYGQGIQAFRIENGQLNDSLKFFKTAKGAVNGMNCFFDYSFAANRDRRGQSPAIKLSDDKQRLYIPLINENDEITGKYLVYVFDGNNYVFHKNLK